jgi:putative FmdB family regulatory protein
VLVSLGLGWYVSPWFLLFTAFVGLNLFQSGWTNWCLMEKILIKMGVPEREGGETMPLYEYRCATCGQQYESYKRLTEEKKEEACPACGGRAVKMGISLFTAKGSSPGGGSSCGAGPRRSPFG